MGSGNIPNPQFVSQSLEGGGGKGLVWGIKEVVGVKPGGGY